MNCYLVAVLQVGVAPGIDQLERTVVRKQFVACRDIDNIAIERNTA